MKKILARVTLVVCLATIAAVTLAVPGARATSTGHGTIHGTVTATTPRFLQGAIAHLVHAPGSYPPPSTPVRMDQRSHQFVPHVLPVLVGTTVTFLNSDAEAHNIYSPDHEGFDLGNWTQGQHREHRFDHEGAYTLLCHLHPSMLGFILVLQNPFFASVDTDGSFTIRDVPPGHYQLVVWQERAESTPVDVTVTSDGTAEVTASMARRH